MTKRMLAVMLLVALILTVSITAYAVTEKDAEPYEVEIPARGKVEIFSGKKTESDAYDYFCISLTDGTAASIVGSSNNGGEMKIYKGQGYMKIYYDTVPAKGATVKLFASLTSLASQTASGASYCN